MGHSIPIPHLDTMETHTTEAPRPIPAAIADYPATIADLLALPGWDAWQESTLGNDLFLSDPDRADRIHEAAEDGCDGSYHSEIIWDWRLFARHLEIEARHVLWMADDEGEAERLEAELERRVEALDAAIDECEARHEADGTLWEQVG
jgi:hypothetical protein